MPLLTLFFKCCGNQETSAPDEIPLIPLEEDTNTLNNNNQNILPQSNQTILKKKSNIKISRKCKIFEIEDNEYIELYENKYIEIPSDSTQIFFSRYGLDDVVLKKPKKEKRLIKEANILCHLGHHSNIIKFKGIIRIKNEIYLMLDNATRGSLHSLIYSKNMHQKKFDKLLIAKSIAKGLAFLHRKNVIHLNLKPSNILLKPNIFSEEDSEDDDAWNGERYIAMIAGFSSAILKEDLKNDLEQNKHRVGTLQWAAPETVLAGEYSEKSDIYSFGMILWALLTCRYPYAGKDKETILDNISNYKFEEIPEVNNKRLEILVELIKKCREKDPKNRPSSEEILNMLSPKPQSIDSFQGKDTEKEVLQQEYGLYINLNNN